MKAVLQRVTRASVAVDGEMVGEIGQGLVVLICVEKNDAGESATYFAGKTARMRIFSDDDGKFNLSLLDTGGSALVISQFTLAGNWQKGNRPSFSSAAAPDIAQPMYEDYCMALKNLGVPVETGVFAAHMDVELVNDGPVTIWMDSASA